MDYVFFLNQKFMNIWRYSVSSRYRELLDFLQRIPRNRAIKVCFYSLVGWQLHHRPDMIEIFIKSDIDVNVLTMMVFSKTIFNM